MIFPLVREMAATGARIRVPVAVACRVLGFSTQAYYKWRAEPIGKDGDGIYDAGETGRKVTLKTDPTQDKTDRYGRLLAYITRPGTNFARNQITRGWGEVYVYNNVPFQQLSAFQAGQDRAKAAGRGVWGKCNGDFHSEQ